ncbi:DUF3011 domain-containing protein [Sphingomonas sp.]|uniref:DUF3011 domain-containing protein n=1 Tax=Sphingomonas sp. TaxID=28214 RepID=UPI002EDAEE3A
MKSTLKLVVLSTALVTQSITPLMAQTRPAPQERPVPLPQPVPDRPVPLPQPVRPEIQPPRPIRPQPPRPVRPQPPRPNPGYGQGYAGSITCESRNSRTRYCNVNTQNRVMLIRANGGVCNQGRGWGYDRRSIWVRNCRAQFAYGYGNNWGGGGWQPGYPDRDKGPSTGLIIGGVAVAAGLIALLASKNKKPNAPATEAPTSYPPGPPAALSADLNLVRSEARPSLQTCLFEASRQIGVTGGTRLRLDRITSIEPGNGGWRFAADLTATYPDGERTTPFYCRATPTKVVQLDFTS